MAYTPTVWKDDDLPAIDATGLNKLENAVKDAHDGKPIVDATAKETPVDADIVGVIDSADTNKLKKLSWVNIKATSKTYFDTLYAAKTPAQFSLSVPTTGWIGATAPFTLDIAKTGVAIGQIYDIYLVYSSDVIATMEAEDKAYACISKIVSGAGKFTLRANKSVPATAITLRAIYKCEEAV